MAPSSLTGCSYLEVSTWANQDKDVGRPRRFCPLLHDFTQKNIVLGDPKKLFDSTLYRQALSITGLDKWAKANNIDDEKTILGNYFEDSVSISSGHWQRIAIARAVYRNREIFLLDQPFTYIDSHSVEEILTEIAIVYW